MLQKIVTMLTAMSVQISDVQTMKSDITEVKVAVSQIKNDASVSAMQTYVTLLSDYQQNGTNSAAYTDPKTWDSLCRSATMINSLKFNGEALDYWISKGYDLEGYFGQIDGFPSSLFRGMTTAAEVMNNEACLDAILGNKTTCYALANSQQLVTVSNSISETLKQKIRSSSNTQTACASSRLLQYVGVCSYSGVSTGWNHPAINVFYVNTCRTKLIGSCTNVSWHTTVSYGADGSYNATHWDSCCQCQVNVNANSIPFNTITLGSASVEIYNYRTSKWTYSLQFKCITF